MVGRSTSKNKPSRTRPLGSLLLETVRLRAEFTRRSGCAAPSLSWPPAVLAAPHCIKTGISAAHRPLPLFDCLSLSVSPSLPLPRRPGRGTPHPRCRSCPFSFREQQPQQRWRCACGLRAPASLLARQSPCLFPLLPCAAPLALRISHPFRNPCRS